MDARPSAAETRTSAPARRPIGEFLVERGLVTPEELRAALQQQSASGKRLGEILVDRGAITRMALASVLGEQWEEAGRHLRAVVPVRLADGKEAESGLAGGVELTDSLASLQAAVARLEELAGEVVQVPRQTAAVGAGMGEIVARLEQIERTMHDGSGLAVGDQLAEAVAAFGRELEEIKVVLGQPITADDALAERLGRIEEALAQPITADDALTERLGRIEEALAQPITADDALTERLGRIEQALERAPDDGLGERLAALDGWLRSRDDDTLGDALRAGLEQLRGELQTLADREPTSDPALAERLERIEQALAADAQSDARFDRLEALLEDLPRPDAAMADLRETIAALPAPASGLDERLAALEQRLDERLTEVTRAATGPDADVVERLDRIEGALSSPPELSVPQELIELVRAAAVPDDRVAERLDRIEHALASELPSEARFGRLEALLHELPRADASLGELREAVAARPARDEELHERLGRLEEAVAAARRVEVPAELAAALATLQEQVAGLPHADVLAGQLDELRLALERGSAPDHVLHELHERLARIDASLAEAGTVMQSPELEQSLAALHQRLDQALAPDLSLHERLSELLGHAGRGAEQDAELVSRLDRLEEALSTRTEQAPGEEVDGALPALREELAALREAVQHRPADWENGDDLRAQLQRLEVALVQAPTGEVAAQLEALTAAVADLGSAGDRPAGPDHELRERIDRLAADLRERSDDGRLLEAVEALAAAQREAPSAEQLGAHVADLLAERAREWQEGFDDVARRLGDDARSVTHTVSPEDVALQVTAALSGDLQALRTHGETAAASAAALDGGLERLRDELQERLDVVREELSSQSRPSAGRIAERVAGALGERLDRIETAVADTSRDGALAARLDSLPAELAGHVREALPRAAAADEIAGRVEERLAGRLDGLDAALRERPELELIDGLRSRLDELAGRLPADRGGELLEQLGRIEHELAAAASALREGFDGRRDQLDGLAAEVSRVDADLARRLEELLGRVGGVEFAVAEAVPHARLDELGERLDSLRSALDEPGYTAVHEQLDAQAAGLEGVRALLERVETAVSDRGDAARVERLEELAAELRDALADPPCVATLTTLVAQSHNALAERLESIESSVAGLPTAPVEAPAPVATAPEPTPAPEVPAEPTSYVAVVPSADGYALVTVDGVLPVPGASLDVAGDGRALVVSRIGRSPLPADRRRCVYLEAV